MLRRQLGPLDLLGSVADAVVDSVVVVAAGV